VDVVVVCEFSSREELVPVILLVVSEKPDELLHLLVDAFGLTVGLQVVGCRGVRFDPNKAPKLGGELGNELGATVGDVLLRSAMELPDIPVIQPGSSDSIQPGRTLHKVSVFTQDVYDNHDRVIAVGFQELDYKVYQDRAPMLLRNLGQVKLANREFPESLGAAAQVAGCHVPADVSGHLGPPVVPGE
jgi:hypothetical protein